MFEQRLSGNRIGRQAYRQHRKTAAHRVLWTLGCLFGLAMYAAGGSRTASADAAEPSKLPNIVYVLADDFGYGDAACYNPEAKIPTPAIDRLAREGMRFTDAHSASAVCSPTRYGILTGRYAWRTWLKRGVLKAYDPPLIDADRLTVPSLLQQHGYRTACIGKWHLGWDWPMVDGQQVFDRPIRQGPTTRGFQHYFGTHVPNQPPYIFLENDRTVGLPTAQKTVRDLNGGLGPMLPGWKFDEILPTLVQRAVQYIDQRAADGQRFFLYFPLTSPHEPIAPSSGFRGKSGISPLADFMMETDAALGAVLEALDRRQLSDHTLVIFTCDNGHATYTGLETLLKAGHHPSGPLRGYKTNIWEGGHRVPFIARWPGEIKPQTVADETICHNNLLATLADLLEYQLPDNAGEDSFSILPLLRGQKGTVPTHPLVVHHSVSGQFALRQGPWKYVEPLAAPQGTGEKPTTTPAPPTQSANAEAREPALFDLRQDLGETKNLAADHPEIVAKMAAQLEQVRNSGRSRPAAAR